MQDERTSHVDFFDDEPGGSWPTVGDDVPGMQVAYQRRVEMIQAWPVVREQQPVDPGRGVIAAQVPTQLR